MLNLCPNSGFDSLCRVAQLSRGRFQVQRLALERHHRNAPIHPLILCFFALFYIAIARIWEYVGCFTARRFWALSTSGTLAAVVTGVIQSGCGIDPNVSLHPKVVLIFLLRLVHLRITRAAIVFCRTERCNQRGVNRRAAFEHSPLACNKSSTVVRIVLVRANSSRKCRNRNFVVSSGRREAPDSKPANQR